MRFVAVSPFSDFLIMRVLRSDLRLVALFLGIAVYAMFGSPTPNVLGGSEVVVGGLLVFAIGAAGFLPVLKCLHGKERWFHVGQVFLVYGLIAGVVGGLASSAGLGAMVRDVLPFGFMFLPLFLMRFCEGGRVMVGVFAVLGLVFAVRASAPVLGLSFGLGYDALYYLGNSPAVLFAAMFLFGAGLQGLARDLSVRSGVKAAVCFGLVFLALVPIVVTAQRAGMAAFAVYAVLAFGVLFMRAPRRMVVVGSVLAAVTVLVFGGMINEAFQGVEAKSALVGANMRFEEWAAVWSEITGNPLTFLFGQGWGASFSSPAVADIEVNFTHSLLSSMLLKLGFVGFLLCGVYVGALFWALLRVFRREPLIVMAIAAPLLIDVFLYAAFKSLDFGLLLALIPIVVFSGDERAEPIAS